eukprot:2874105-Pyramimonas_sp.AAC.1
MRAEKGEVESSGGHNKAKGPTQPRLTLALHEHGLVELGNRLFCRRCRRSAKTAEARRQLTG